MRSISAPHLPPAGLHAGLDAVVTPLRELYLEHAVLASKANEIEDDIADEAAQADIDAARAASLGRATPGTSKKAHALVADQLEVARALAVVASAIASATDDLNRALTEHGKTWATEVEEVAMKARTAAFVAAIEQLAEADIGLQEARSLTSHLRDRVVLQPVQHGTVWALQRPSGERTTMGEVLGALKRYASEAAPDPRGRLRFDMPGSRSA